MNTFEDYLRTFAAELRSNGIRESTLADILAEVASDPTIDPSHPEATLGTAKQFAASYEKTPARSAGFKIFSIFGILALIIVGAKVVSSLVLGVQTSIPVTLLIYSVAVIVAVTGVAIGSRVDRRLPGELESRFRS